jgi:hypothetical protein
VVPAGVDVAGAAPPSPPLQQHTAPSQQQQRGVPPLLLLPPPASLQRAAAEAVTHGGAPPREDGVRRSHSRSYSSDDDGLPTKRQRPARSRSLSPREHDAPDAMQDAGELAAVAAPAVVPQQLQQVALPPAAPPPAAPPPPPAHDAAVWHYRTPRNGVQGPFSLAQLATFRAALQRLNRWSTLRVWRSGQTEADAVLLTTLVPSLAERGGLTQD